MQPKSTRGVQQVDVDFAADALLAEQHRPTIERVRLKLGRGSPNTVAPMLESWFARLGSRLGMPGAAGAGQPGESIPVAVQTAAQTLWKSALGLAQEQAKQALHERDVALGVRQAELDGLAQALTQREVTLAGKEEALHEGLNLAKRQLDEQAAKNAQLQLELERANGQLTVARAAAADQVQAASAERQRMVARLSEVIATQQQAEERAGATERRFLAEVDRGRQEVKRLQGELKASQQQSIDGQAAQRLVVEAVELRLRQRDQQLSEAKALCKELRDEAARSAVALERQTKEFVRLGKVHRELEVQLAAKTALVEGQERAFSELAARIPQERIAKSRGKPA